MRMCAKHGVSEGKRRVFLLFVEKCSILFHHFPYRVRQYPYCVSRSNKDVRGLPYCILKHPYWMGQTSRTGLRITLFQVGFRAILRSIE